MTQTESKPPRVPHLIWNEKLSIWETPSEKLDRERSERYMRDNNPFRSDWHDATAYSQRAMMDLLESIRRAQNGTTGSTFDFKA